MAYKTMEWVDGSGGGTPLNAENLNNMIAGIDEAKAEKENLENKVLTYNTDISVVLNSTKYPSMETLAALMMVYFPQKTFFVFQENNSTGGYTYSFSADDNTTVFNQSIVSNYIAMETSTKKLVSVYIGSQVAAISAGAFLRALYLENMYVNNSPEKIGIADDVFLTTDFPVYYLRISEDLYKSITNKLDDADYSVNKNNLSEELQALLDEYNSTDFMIYYDEGTLSDSSALNYPKFVGFGGKYRFKATGNLAEIFGGESEHTLTCEMQYNPPYQIVTVVDFYKTFIREVYQAEPYWRSGEWVEKSYSQAETDALLANKLDDADYSVNKNNLSEELQALLDEYNSTDFMSYRAYQYELTERMSLDAPGFANSSVIHLIEVSGDLATEITGVSNNSFTAELRYIPPYQVVRIVGTQQTFIREVKRIAPNFNAGEWEEQPEGGYTKAETDSLLAEKSDVENGTIGQNTAWYAYDDTKTMTGTYQLMGDYCFLSATAQRIDGWGVVYYSLPVASTAAATTAAVNDTNYTINTATQNNISVLEIMRVDRQTMSGGELYFTLIYKYK